MMPRLDRRTQPEVAPNQADVGFMTTLPSEAVDGENGEAERLTVPSRRASLQRRFRVGGVLVVSALLGILAGTLLVAEVPRGPAFPASRTASSKPRAVERSAATPRTPATPPVAGVQQRASVAARTDLGQQSPSALFTTESAPESLQSVPNAAARTPASTPVMAEPPAQRPRAKHAARGARLKIRNRSRARVTLDRSAAEPSTAIACVDTRAVDDPPQIGADLDKLARARAEIRIDEKDPYP
jgi:hypothetical protein